MQKVTTQVFVNNPVNIQYIYPQVVYNYLLKHNINNMLEKQFNKTFVKYIPQFNQYNKKQKAQIFVYVTDLYNQYINTNQI